MEVQTVPARTVLLVTALEGAAGLAAAVSEHVGVVLELVRSRRAALASLRRYQFDVVVVDSALPDGEVTPTDEKGNCHDGLDMLWQTAEGAMPLELDLRLLGANGVVRVLSTVLDRREQMEASVRESVTRSIAEELRGVVTGLLLQSDLVLRDKALTPAVEAKVREMRALADGLRVRLRPV